MTENEKTIDKYLVRKVTELGGECLKYTNQNKSGYPDRLVLLPGGVTAWVELKGPKLDPRPLQMERMKRLRDLGQRVYVADCFDKVDAILKALKR